MVRDKSAERPSSRRTFWFCGYSVVDCKRRLLASTALVSAAGCFVAALPALANPVGGQVVAGGATIVQTSPTREDINQSTGKAIINWQSFSIKQGEQVNFNQPSASAIALNRVTGGDASKIAGQLTANGQVWLVNPNGVFFSKTAQVNVGGLVATTSDISDKNFMAGRYVFDKPGNPNARVVNDGSITVAQAGMAALVAPNVRNSGVIEAKLGKVALASGNEYTLDLYGDGLVKFAINDQTAASLKGARVSSSGTIDADGGIVLLTASAAAGIVDNAINVGGTITARTTDQGTGKIVVDGNGGATTVHGTLDASGYGAGQSGGTVEVLGENVQLTNSARLDVSGDTGGGTVLVGGNFHGAGPQRNATRTTVAKGATIKANAITKGNGGGVAIWSNKATSFDGTIEARGGAAGGNGGMAETSGGSLTVGIDALVDTTAPAGTAGTWLLDPQNIDVVGGTPSSGQIAASAVVNGLATSDVLLQAGNDITVDGAIDSSGNANTHDLTLEAGESVNVNANIKLNGSFSATANDSADANGTTMLAADRQIGTGNFNMLAGTSIDVTIAPGQSVSIAIGPSVANPSTGGAYTPGYVQLAGINTGNGNLTVSGDETKIVQTADGLTVGGTSSFTAGAPNAFIDLESANNALAGTVSLGASNNATLTNGLATDLGTSITGGSLTLNSGGAVTQSGSLRAGWATTVTAPTIALDDPGNALNGPIALTSTGDASVVNSIAMNLGASSVGGNLTASAETGDISESGPVTVAGTADIIAGYPGAEIALTDPGNRFGGAVTLGASDDIDFVNGAPVTDLGQVIAGGAFTVDARNGDVTQTGPLMIGWATTVSGGVIALDDAGNALNGPISLTSTGDASVVNSKAINLGASTIGGNLSVTAAPGDIAESGPVTVLGTADITAGYPGANIALTDPGNQFNGMVTLGASDNVAFVNDAPATILGNVIAGGALSVLSQGGDIVQAAGTSMRSGWTASFGAGSAGSNVYVSNAGNAFAGPVTIFASDNVSLYNGVATNLAGMVAGGALTVKVGSGDLTQSGQLRAGWTSSFTTDAPNAKIALNDPSNVLPGAVTVRSNGSGGDVTLANDADTTLTNSSVGGALSIDAGNHALDLQTDLGVLALNLHGSRVVNTDSNYTLAVANGAPAGTLGDSGDLENVTVGGVGGPAVARDFLLTPPAIGHFIINGSEGQNYTPPPAPQIPSPDPAPLSVSQVQPTDPSSVTAEDADAVQGIAAALALADEKSTGSGSGMTGAGAGGADALFAPLFEQVSEVDDFFASTALLQSALAAQPATVKSPEACSSEIKKVVVCVPGTQSAQSPQ